MTDQSDYARGYARDIGVNPPINGTTNVQDALAFNPPSHWIATGVPTADPHVVGQVWADAGVLTVSAG